MFAMSSLRVLTVCITAAAALAPAWGGDAEAEPKDLWKGRHRTDVVALLGEPSKTKKASDGSTVLIYKLIRVGEKAVPGPNFRVLDLPGVGLVGRVVKNEDPSGSETPTIEPAGFDDKGRPFPGATRTETASTAWGWQTGEGTGPEPPQKGPRSGGKVRLEIVLDASGFVEDWSVSPK